MFNIWDPSTWFSSPGQILTVPGGNTAPPITGSGQQTPKAETTVGNTPFGGPWTSCPDEYSVSTRLYPLGPLVIIPVEHIIILFFFGFMILLGIMGLVLPSSQTIAESAG